MDRRRPSELRDVTRLEHENLASEVMQNTRTLERLEYELRALRETLEALQVRSNRR